jgi:hypothetical protein
MLTINQVILVCRIQELDNEKNKQNSMLKEKDGDVTILKTQIQSLVCTKFYTYSKPFCLFINKGAQYK